MKPLQIFLFVSLLKNAIGG